MYRFGEKRERSVTKEKHKSIGSGEIPKGGSEGPWEGESCPGEHLHFKGKESTKEREKACLRSGMKTSGVLCHGIKEIK